MSGFTQNQDALDVLFLLVGQSSPHSLVQKLGAKISLFRVADIFFADTLVVKEGNNVIAWKNENRQCLNIVFLTTSH